MVNPVEEIFPSPLIFEALRRSMRKDDQVFIVGGSVRDLLMQRKGRDIDLVVNGNALDLARRTADAVGASYYVLDADRQTARAIYYQSEYQRWFLDFSTMRGSDITEDLEGRDFTINAIAINLDQPDQLIDPLQGAQAIKDHRLEICSPHAFRDDPLRVMRAVRLSADLGFRMSSETVSTLKKAVPLLIQVSIERKRDELFHILESPAAGAGLRTGFLVGMLDDVLPEVARLKGEHQAAPHVYDVFEHTLALVDAFVELYDLLVEPFIEGKGSNLIYGMALMEIGRFRQDLARHYSARMNPDRSLFALNLLAGLLHDAAKPDTRSYDEDGHLHFYEHDVLGAQMAKHRAEQLALSNNEVERLTLLVHHHMRFHQLAKRESEINRRSIYRYYRDLGEAGVDLVLLALADKLAVYGVTITPAEWQKELHAGRQLLEAWFNHKEDYVYPPRLVSGQDLIKELNFQPGPGLGRVLEAIREAQAIGIVTSREEAFHYAVEWMSSSN